MNASYEYLVKFTGTHSRTVVKEMRFAQPVTNATDIVLNMGEGKTGSFVPRVIIYPQGLDYPHKAGQSYALSGEISLMYLSVDVSPLLALGWKEIEE